MYVLNVILYACMPLCASADNSLIRSANKTLCQQRYGYRILTPFDSKHKC